MRWALVVGFILLSFLVAWGLYRTDNRGFFESGESTEIIEKETKLINEEGQVYKILVVGDVMIGRTVNRIAGEKNDWGWVFMDTQELLRSADVTIGNLESPIVEDCPVVDSGFVFCGDVRWAKEIALAGFDVVSLANNHATNYGAEGIETTKRLLTSNRVSVVGLGEPVIVDVGELLIGILAYNDVGEYAGIANVEGFQWEREISELNNIVDVVIVYYHWGWEYTATANARQMEIGRKSIDAGADVVVGAHPHWVQNIEEYRGGYIFYSLGNFVFDQMWSEETRRGMVVEIYMVKEGVTGFNAVNTLIEDYGRAVILE